MKINDLIKQLRKTMPNDIAHEICSVQPIDSNIMKNLYEQSKSENDLINEGYEPVSNMKLMYVKVKDEK